MTKNTKSTAKLSMARAGIALAIILFIAALVLGVDQLQRTASQKPAGTSTPLPAGSIPIYLNGTLIGGLVPADLEKLKMVSFVDAEAGKTQEGWLLKDVLLLYIQSDELKPDTQVTVSSSSEEKSAQVSWQEAENEENMVMFDLSNRGTMKLVSKLPRLSTRNYWVQDVDKIEVVTK
jgi:hypothetical protein